MKENIKIVEYDEKYLEDVKDLLVELEEYIVSIDKDNLDRVHEEYRDKMAILDLEEVNENSGKCYLAIEDDTVIGMVMGIVRSYDEYDYLDYKCPKAGEVTELIVSNKCRGNGVGKLLLETIENYFRSIDCKYVLVDVFGYNDRGINFYNKNNYRCRMITNIKEL